MNIVRPPIHLYPSTARCNVHVSCCKKVGMSCSAVLCRAVPCCAVLCFDVMCFDVKCFDVKCFDVMCFDVLHFDVMCFDVLCCAVLCRLVEEFMLLANMATARKIALAFPNTALLRRHQPPKEHLTSRLVGGWGLPSFYK